LDQDYKPLRHPLFEFKEQIMKTRALSVVILLLVLTCIPLSVVQADGIIIPEPPVCPPASFCPPLPRPISQLEIRYHHVNVTIQDQLAVTRIDQVFYNPNTWAVEGTYIFPLPIGAAVSNFTLWIDGQPVQGDVMDAEKARQVYQDIVNSLRDPALLEYVGRGAVQANIFPIPPEGERRIELEYSQILNVDSGLVHYVYPLNTEKYSAQPIKSVSVSINVNASQPVRAIYSPSHPIEIIRDGLNGFTASYEASNVLPDADFALYYSLGETPAFHVMTYRDPGNLEDPDGFFLLLLAPQPDAQPEAIAKDLFLVLDRSGSMDGEKFIQAKTALGYILNHLNPEDRFYLSAFSSGIEHYANSLSPASKYKDALAWVDQLSAQGSTDINLALLEAAAVTDQERPTYLIFLTDGLPTEGVVDSQKILDNFEKNAPSNLRLFSFGVGYDVDTYLLDSLSQQHHGLSTYVTPGKALDEILSGFYARISTPVLTDLNIDFGSMLVYDLFPSPLPDLFAGSQLIITGRYRTAGSANVSLHGEVNGQAQVFNYPDISFSIDSRSETGPMNELPRLWATRKVGYLLNQVRLHGPNQELIDQIVRLSIRFGIVTPYTSYLVTEPMPLGGTNQERLSLDAYQQSLAAPTLVYGAEAVEKAAGQGQLERAEIAAPVPFSSGQLIRVVGARTFVFQDGIWLDTTFDPEKMKTLKIAFLSPDYFDLADTRPDISPALALGDQVIVVIDGDAYEVVSTDSVLPQVPLPEPVVPEVTQTNQQPPAEPTQTLEANPARDTRTQTPALPGFCLGSYLPLITIAGLFVSHFRRK
jgi:Ca-activated chloride channel homolog